MSRNKEKAQSSLNRFYALKNQQAGVLESNPNLRPKYVQSVQSLPQAEKWRTTVIGEISVKLTRIQDNTASDADIRELNDSLNKLFNEKRAWEYHIKSLGGNDYINFGRNLNNTGILANVDSSGTSVRGYRYFGRAKDLPDVKKILEKAHEKTGKPKKKEEVQKATELPLEYYGLYDEVPKPREIFSESDIDLINEISASLGESAIAYEPTQDPQDPLLEFEKARGLEILQELRNQPEKTGDIPSDFEMEDFQKVVPTNDEVKKWLVERKRKELLAKLGI